MRSSKREVTVHEAKTHLSRLLHEVEKGHAIVVRRGRKPVARIIPFEPERPARRIGGYEGRIAMAPDFDAPLEGFDGDTVCAV
ncbi:MAG: type II toxin-antitoxin system prevent-host-death family antitoxin [Myxococcota bacterium]